ncbi:MAG: SUMF1/EgtB/PvdO family nonheme iron enzyme [Planctomycetes bacterium]|nr:SUMF1/EgtB/PvdO family nonheme iron enzyme [Planctomycetota bacterium]
MYRKLEAGDRVSEYVLVTRLGQGGFGEVWKAEHAQLPDKFVAIKVPTSPDSMALILNEAVFQHQLEHPNIVRTIGLNTEHDPPYFIMEFVEGRNLREFMATEGILPPPYAIDVAVQVLEALAYAHSRGVIHKDIKPENILVERRRVHVAGDHKALLHYVKITDLGLGKVPDRGPQDVVISEQARTSGMRQLSGTLFYMAPEQMLGGRIDGRADLYSVGVVLYEMLTGEMPLGMDLPSELNPVVTPVLDQICKRALSIDPDHRYQTASEMIGDLLKAKENFLTRLVAATRGAEANELKPPKGPALAAASDERRSSPSWRRLEWSLMVIVSVLLGVSAFAFWKTSGGMDPMVEVVPASGEFISGPLRIDPYPADAEVFLGGRRFDARSEFRVPFALQEIRVDREFFEPRQITLEPRLVGGRRCLAIVDAKTKSTLDVIDFDRGLPRLRVELPRQKGSLEVRTSNVEQALVFLDDEQVGVTNLTLNDLPAGPRTLRLSKEGYENLEMQVTIRAGVKPLLELHMVPSDTPPPSSVEDAFHVVTVNSRPAGATVFLNEENRGVTPIDLRVPSGTYSLRLEMKYHETIEEPVLKVSSRQVMWYPLARISKPVAFDSEPRGASVLIDGIEAGKTPLQKTVEGGTHHAEFLLPGYYRRELPFEVGAARPGVSVKAELQKIPPGRLSVECDIPGMALCVNDAIHRAAPMEPMELDAGRHRIRILGVEKEVVLEPGNTLHVRFSLSDLKMVRVPAGKFLFGVPEKDWAPRLTKMQEEYLPEFLIDQYEVTNEQYAAFLDWMRRTNDHSKCDPAEGKNKNHTPYYWNDPRYEDLKDPKKPVVGVDYYDAHAYAAWAGKRLPTEREWEKAARGPEGRTYPWGNDWRHSEDRLNWGDGRGSSDSYERTAPVGSFPEGISPMRCFDMAGNVWEWTSDLFDRGHTRVVKGGSFLVKELCRAWERDFQAPNQAALKDVGFRCAVSAPKEIGK